MTRIKQITQNDHEFLMALISKRETCKCEFCEVAIEEDELFEIGGYKLCMDCKAEYLLSTKND